MITVADANDIGILSDITGTPRQGQQLMVGTLIDEDSMSNIRYQWTFDNGDIISGATNSTYTLQSTDVGRQIRVEVTYDDGFANDNQLTSNSTIAISSSSFNATLVESDDNGGRFFYLENDVSVIGQLRFADPDPLDTVVDYEVEGANAHLFSINSSGELTFNSPPNFEMPLDQGSSRNFNNNYNIGIFAIDSDGNRLSLVLPFSVLVEDVNDVGSLSEITGVLREGSELTVGDISDEDGSIGNERYQWFSDGDAILAAQSSTYTLTSSEVGTVISVRVIYNDGFANDNQLVSEETLPITGLALNATFSNPASVTYMENLESVVLTASATDPDPLDTVANYTIAGLDSSFFSINSSGELTFNSPPNYESRLDNGQNNVYDLTINALNSSDIILGSQSVTITVVDVNDIGVLSEIIGIAREGEVLTAGDLFDEDGSINNERYQWLSDGTEIASATNSTYTLQSSDVGTEISVRVTYDDGFGTDHQLTSEETTLVSSVTPNATFDSSASVAYMENLESVVLTVSATDPDPSDMVARL